MLNPFALMCSNSIANISKRCLRRLSETRFSDEAVRVVEPFFVNKQQWRSITNSASITKCAKFYPPYHSRTFSTTSSPPPKKRFLGWYLSKLDSNPLITKSVTSSIIYAAADFTSQKDTWTTLKKILMGQTTFGPVINSIFFSYSAVLQGEREGEIVPRLKHDVPPNIDKWPLVLANV